MARLSRSARFWIVVSAINLTIPAVLIWKVHATDLTRSAALSSCWISFLFLNALLLVALRFQDSGDSWPSKRDRVVFTLLLAVTVAVATTVYLSRYFETNTYTALASSDRPLSSIYPKRRRLVVELIRERARSSKAYQAAASHFPAISPPLYSAESFSTVDVMNGTLRHLQEAFEIDASYSRQLADSMDRFERQMRQVDPEYLQSWIASDGPHEKEQSDTFAIEGQWVRSVQALYQYSADHHPDIRTRNGQLDFSSNTIKAQFEALEDASQKLQRKLENARSNLGQEQQKAARDSHH